MCDQYAYSFDGQLYHGSCNSRAAAEREAKRDDRYRGTVWIGKIQPPADPWLLISAEDLIEHVQNRDDYSNEAAEDWPVPINKQRLLVSETARDDLEYILKQWFNKHYQPPSHYLVIDVRVSGTDSGA